MDQKPEEKQDLTLNPSPETGEGLKDEDITAEFKTEEIKKEAETIPQPAVETPVPEHQKTDLKSWIPVFVGLITLAGMVIYALRFWLVR